MSVTEFPTMSWKLKKNFCSLDRDNIARWKGNIQGASSTQVTINPEETKLEATVNTTLDLNTVPPEVVTLQKEMEQALVEIPDAVVPKTLDELVDMMDLAEFGQRLSGNDELQLQTAIGPGSPLHCTAFPTEDQWPIWHRWGSVNKHQTNFNK